MSTEDALVAPAKQPLIGALSRMRKAQCKKLCGCSEPFYQRTLGEEREIVIAGRCTPGSDRVVIGRFEPSVYIRRGGLVILHSVSDVL